MKVMMRSVARPIFAAEKAKTAKTARRHRASIFLAGLLLAPFVTLPAARAAEFDDVVSQILMRQTDGPISEMSEEKKRLMIACVNQTLTALPDPKKRYVQEGADLDAQEDRFGEVVLEDRAKWKQKIASDCSDIALEDSP